jgi:TatD DNase family protein
MEHAAPPASVRRGLIDSHAHLDMEAFDKDRQAVIMRAWEAGLEAIITIGSGDTLYSNERAIQIASAEERMFATVGVHPHRASDVQPHWLTQIRAYAAHPKVVAIGETGLDYHYLHSPEEVQRRVFGEFLQMARELKKPIVIHDREAHGDLLEVLTAEGGGGVEGVVHCFSGDYGLARRCLDLGLYLSFTGVITFPKAEKERDVIRRLPLERVLIETDAPYLAPVPRRGHRNEPSFVIFVAQEIARIRTCSLEDVAAITSENARALFGLPPDEDGHRHMVT